MSAPDIIACLRSVGYPVPDGAQGCTVADPKEPTWIKFHNVQGGVSTTTTRQLLTPEHQALVLRAIQLHFVGRRLSK